MGILDHVMEYTRLYCHDIWLESEHQFGSFEWMRDIGFSTLSHLGIVSLTSKYIGIPDSFLDFCSFPFAKIRHHPHDELIGETITDCIVDLRDGRIDCRQEYDDLGSREF